MQIMLAMLCCVACAAAQYFSNLSHTRHYFRKKAIEHKINVLIFFKTLKTFSLLEQFREIILQMYIDLQVK